MDWFIGMKNEYGILGSHILLNKGERTVSKKNVLGVFQAIFSTALYIGLFGGIGYLIQMTLL